MHSVQLQLEAGQQALAELQRLQAESEAKRQEVASLEASRDVQAAALADLARQRDEEASRRWTRILYSLQVMQTDGENLDGRDYSSFAVYGCTLNLAAAGGN